VPQATVDDDRDVYFGIEDVLARGAAGGTVYRPSRSPTARSPQGHAAQGSQASARHYPLDAAGRTVEPVQLRHRATTGDDLDEHFSQTLGRLGSFEDLGGGWNDSVDVWTRAIKIKRC